MPVREKDQTHKLSRMLETADPVSKLHQSHVAYFAETPSIRPVVEVSPSGIVVKLSKRLKDMPDAALMETFDMIYARIDNPNMPRFGPKAASYLQSDAFIESLRKSTIRQKYPVDSSINSSILGHSKERVMKMIPEAGLTYNARKIDIKWRPGAPLLDSEYIASTNPLMQVIRIDARLSAEKMPIVIQDYVCFREVLAVASYDHEYARVDTDVYEKVHRRFPDHDRLASLCMELGWRFTIPLEGEL